MASLNQILKNALVDTLPLLKRYGVEVQRDPLPDLQVDSHKIKKVFKEILLVCLEHRYTHAKCKILVQAFNILDTGFWMIRVVSNGYNIDPDYNLLEKPGMKLCQETVATYGGQFLYKNIEPRGNIFSFTLPCNTVKL